MENLGMKIPVIFVTGEVGNVNRSTLNSLIQEKTIVAFRRSDGWVQIACDPIRKTQEPLTRPGNRQDDLRP